MNQSERRLFLIRELLNEKSEYGQIKIPKDEEEQKRLLRGLMNIRGPKKISDDFIKVQDEYLSYEIEKNGIIDINTLTPVKDGIYIYQGDITKLKCDAVVNAANSGMTGCYRPNHNCIDNCIHTFAGIQLRLLCAEIMEKQGHSEETGTAKITPAFNLPSKYIIHTVGPVVHGKLTEDDCRKLTDSYNACLNIAAENNVESIAFCCISTGVFCFPNETAAEIAVRTVSEFMKKDTSVKKVIFNVFKDIDREIYERILIPKPTA